MSDNLSEHVAENRRYWDAMADDWVILGERAWEHEARWGERGIPNTELPLLADEMQGQRAIELGCGTGCVSAWKGQALPLRAGLAHSETVTGWPIGQHPVGLRTPTL